MYCVLPSSTDAAGGVEGSNPFARSNHFNDLESLCHGQADA